MASLFFLLTEKGSILRNLERIRAMGNTSLEEAERARGQKAIAMVLEQLIRALTAVGARADKEKAVADAARIDAEVQYAKRQWSWRR